MGALTLKTFPYEIRGWDIESYESVDPTDSFGQNTKVYIENNQIVKIEPNFNNLSKSPWLTDKGRNFFDSFYPYKGWSLKKEKKDLSDFEILKWDLGQSLYETLYIFNMCNLKNVTKQFFIVLFEFLSIETLNLLLILSQTNPFVKLKRAENFKFNNDLESNFQLDSVISTSKLLSVSLCLLISTNSRYENSHLNLKLRQRYFKGNFEVMTIGPLFDLTFSTLNLGSSMSTFKTIVEGNNIFCQDLKMSRNNILIHNTEILKRNDLKNLLSTIKTFKFTNLITKTWNGFNSLNSYLNESGVNSLSSFSFLTFKDLLSFSSIYIINVTINKLSNFKTKFIETKLLNFTYFKKTIFKKLLLIDHTFLNKNNVNFYTSNSRLIKFKSYLYLPSNKFFEDNETFINTEGLIKRTTKLVFKEEKTVTKSNWQLIRKFINYNKKSFIYLNNKNELISFNSNNPYNFKNFITLQYFATQSLTDFNFYLNTKNVAFVIYKTNLTFKLSVTKLYNTKFKYWLDDYFNGDKDNYTVNSVTLSECSKLSRINSSTFF